MLPSWMTRRYVLRQQVEARQHGRLHGVGQPL
jgi:hypothetical protein